MRIQVTQEDIDQGEKYNARGCPVACVIKRAGFPYAAVSFAKLIFLEPGSEVVTIVPMPPEVAAFSLAYDSFQAVEPFSFELDDNPREPL